MKIAILYEHRLDYCPPLVAIARTCASLGEEVVVICNEVDESIKQLLSSEGIDVIEMELNLPVTTGKWYGKLRGFRRIPDLIHWHIYKKKRHHILQSILKKRTVDLFWIAWENKKQLVDEVIYDYPFVLQFFELWDYYTANRAVAEIARRASVVVVPEFCRAHIGAWIMGLAEIPEVLVNKPFATPTQRHLPISDAGTAELLAKAGGKKILLYQGNITRNRCPLQLAEASIALADEYTLVLLGRTFDDQLDRLLRINPDIIYLPFRPAPEHL